MLNCSEINHLVFVFFIAVTYLQCWNAFFSSFQLLKTHNSGYSSRLLCYSIEKSVVLVNNDSVEMQREALVQVIHETWNRVIEVLDHETLQQCDEELKDITSMLVLAAIKRAADQDSISKEIIQSMLHAADVNQDGQLTFQEWFKWLQLSSSKSLPTQNNDTPLILSLKTVLIHAVRALQATAKISQETSTLMASFVGGGIMSGILDVSITSTMLLKLSPQIREAVTLALTLESASSVTNAIASRFGNSLDNSRLILSSYSQELVLPSNIVDEVDDNPIYTIELSNSSFTKDSLTFENDMKFSSSGDINEFDSLPFLNTIYNDVQSMRLTLRDLSDNQILSMRQLILSKCYNRKDILTLSVALRTARLQHVAMTSSLLFPKYLKHQLALESLQLWAPISHQFGLAKYNVELEVMSYILLFPYSFGSFINWYNYFRPVAKKVISDFRKQLQEKIEEDSILQYHAKNVVIQSRIKTASSAFKKMVKDAKSKTEMFDFIGLRLIADVKDLLVLADGQVFVRKTDSMSAQDNTITHESEKICIQRLLKLAGDVNGWEIDRSRLKDYVSTPKVSGYQSLHVTMYHISSRICMEIQIRSKRMHWISEYGAASHNNYKALLLPQNSSFS